MIRSVLAVAAGILVGIGLIFLGHFLSSFVFPLPEGLDWKDEAALDAHMATMPTGAFVLVLLSHAMGPFGGGFVAALIARRGKVICALIVGVFFLAGGVMELAHPHPLWYGVAEALIYLPAAYAGALLAPRPRVANVAINGY